MRVPTDDNHADRSRPERWLVPIPASSRPARTRKGAALLESAIILNVFFLLFLGIVEFGRLLMAHHLVDNAAREAARLASSGTADLSTSAITSRALSVLEAQTFQSTPTVSVYKANASGNNIGSWTDAAFGERIAVEVSASYESIIPGFGVMPSTISLHAKSIMRSEGD